MTELSGTLDGVRLAAVVRFLSGLGMTGCLRLDADICQAAIDFAGGRVVDARVGSRCGLPALEGLIQSLPNGRFTFESDTRAVAADDTRIELSPEALQARLDELATQTLNGAQELPSLDAVARVVASPAPGEEELSLERGTLQTLLAVDGQRAVRDIVVQRGTFDVVWQLAGLRNLRLITLTAPAPAPAPAPPANAAEGRLPLAAGCPRLGFEDDPANSFGRATRLHRCFAAGPPLTVPLDQQRELCLSPLFGTCPRLARAGDLGGPQPVDPYAAAVDAAAEAPVEPQTTEPEDPRIVRLPFVARATRPERGPVTDRHVGGRPELTRLRWPAAPARETAATRPTPLRARMDRLTSASHSAANGAPAASPRPPLPPAPPSPPRETTASALAEPQPEVTASDAPVKRRLKLSVPSIAAGAAIVGVIAAIAFLVSAQPGDLFSDDSIDAARLPTAAALAKVDRPSRSTAQPRGTPVAQAPAAMPASASPPGESTAAGGPISATASVTVLDERFATPILDWPSDPQGPALLTDGMYRVTPRQAGQFVAIGAPIFTILQDVIVSATFRKLDGPPGGGYGIIVRDQALEPQTGTGQTGRYYVFEVGDQGEVGIWRRDQDRWAEMLAWTHADAVKPGAGVNELVVRSSGPIFSMSVNGSPVVTRTDATYTSGAVGLFVGGDGNVVAADQFKIQTP